MMTWDDFANLSAGQKAKLQQFAAIGNALGGVRPTPNPDISAVTYSQAKQAEVFLRDLYTLVGPAIQGAKYVREKSRETALSTFDQQNP